MEKLLRQYENKLSGNDSNRRSYVKRAAGFLEYCQGDFSRASVERYINHLREEGYADGTVSLVFGIIRRLYKVNDIEWPFRHNEGPVVREMEVFAPALNAELVEKIIVSAREGVLDEQESAMAALSTVYGLRRAEMMSTTPRCVDLKSRLLYVETAKHGRQRWHVIPEDIVPVLERYDFRCISQTKVTKIYYSIERKVGLPRMQELGWHAIRRMLTRKLVEAGLPVPFIRNFLRWKRSAVEMVERYFSVTVVGVTGERVEMAAEDREVDARIFAAHPFLPFWRLDNGQA